MAKTSRRLSYLILALILALATFPHVARSDYFSSDDDSWYDDSGWYDDDYWYYDDDYWYDDSWYEEDTYTSSWTDDYAPGSWVLGVDVSEWNGDIDWELVRDGGVGFAIIKCGGSDDWWGCYEDSQFLHNALECERLGIPYGVYFYSTAQSSWYASVEADFVTSLLAGYGLHPSLPVFLDLESEEIAYMDYDVACDVLDAVSSTFCSQVEAWGYEPGLYASSSWWEYFMVAPQYDEWACWVAQYDGWLDVGCDCWQYSPYGDIWGIDWPVDLNIWFV